MYDGKSINRISTTYLRTKSCLFHREEVQPATRLLAGHPREWCHIWDSALHSAVGWSTLSSSCSQVSCSEWKSMPNPHLCHHGHFVQGPIGQWHEQLGKEADCPQKESSYRLDQWTPCQVKSRFNEHLHGIYKDLHTLSHLVRSIHALLPRYLFSPIFQSCSFQVPDHPVNPLATAH